MTYKNHLNSLTNKSISNILIIIISLVVYFLWHLYISNETVNYTNLTISIGHFGYLGLLIIPAFLILNNSFLQKFWIFFSGLAILDLPPLMYVVNNQNIDPSIFYSTITISIIIFLLLISILYGITGSTINTKFNTKSEDILIVFSSSLFFTLLYHGSNYYLKIYQNVPNEERSIFINGLEFHHINYGLILLVLVPFLFKYASKFKGIKSLLIYIFIGFIYGTVFDECYYYMLKDMTDDAYLYPNIFFIQIIFMTFVFSFWYYLIKKKGKYNA